MTPTADNPVLEGPLLFVLATSRVVKLRARRAEEPASSRTWVYVESLATENMDVRRRPAARRAG
jgi:hypothetical protein